MKKNLIALAIAIHCLAVVVSLNADIIFQDGFESGVLGSQWTAGGTAQGRVRVTGEFQPASGSRHLVLDDSVLDSVVSTAYVTLNLDLSHKRNVLLSFKIKSLGNESDSFFNPGSGLNWNPRSDSIGISLDGGASWQFVSMLADIGFDWTDVTLSLDYAARRLQGRGYPSEVLIRFAEYDNAPAPLDGIALDDIVVSADEDPSVTLELPDHVAEGSGPHLGYIIPMSPLSRPMTLRLTSIPTNVLVLPETVVIPAGETVQSFTFGVPEDSVFTGQRIVEILAMLDETRVGYGHVSVTENDPLNLSLKLPAQLTEGVLRENNAELNLNPAPGAQLQVHLISDPPNRLNLPFSIAVNPGQTQVVFSVQALPNQVLEGNIPVTLTAWVEGGPQTEASTLVIDATVVNLDLSTPVQLLEGEARYGFASLSGMVTTPLRIKLRTVGSAALRIPEEVIIPAGGSSGPFLIEAVENTIMDGSRSSVIYATAEGFQEIARTVEVRDNEVAGYGVSPLSDLMEMETATMLTISANDIEGNTIPLNRSDVRLSVVLKNGSKLPLSPSGVALDYSGRWTGLVSIPSVTDSPLRFLVEDSQGNTSESASFDLLRSLNLGVADLLWDASRNHLLASVPATANSPYASKVVILDPLTLQVLASVPTGQDPGRLALTRNGEALYVALNRNGTIAKIDLSTLSVVQRFAIGTSTNYGTLFAEDLCTVSGAPDLLVVSAGSRGDNQHHLGVYVYNKGVVRPISTPEGLNNNSIEPSSDPTLFYGCSRNSYPFSLRKLRLDANGIRVVGESQPFSFTGIPQNITADGDLITTTSGMLVDGRTLQFIGQLPATGVIVPESTKDRVLLFENGGCCDVRPHLSAYSTKTLTRLESIGFPTSTGEPQGMVRWGGNGLAIRTAGRILTLQSRQLIADDPPADLAITVTAVPKTLLLGTNASYQIVVTNLGPNTATYATLALTLSESQAFVGVQTTQGRSFFDGHNINAFLNDLAAGASVTLTVQTRPGAAGIMSCTAMVSSLGVDPNPSNNVATDSASVGFQLGMNSANSLLLHGVAMIADPNRNGLWVIVEVPGSEPRSYSVLFVDPSTGLASNPLPLKGPPSFPPAWTLSLNGRYLFVGIQGTQQIQRFDLKASPVSSLQIPLPGSGWPSPGDALDIEPLPGEGTSFLVVGADRSAAVFDSTVRRSRRTLSTPIDEIEGYGDANTFAGRSGSSALHLTVNSTGVSISQTVIGLLPYNSSAIRGSEGLLLSNSGLLLDARNLYLAFGLGASGAPCLDVPNQRAYLAANNRIQAFDINSGDFLDSFELSNQDFPYYGFPSLQRWGLDGLAALASSGRLHLVRWSGVIPPDADRNHDGLPDAWEAAHFRSLEVDPLGDEDGDGIPNAFEYLFGSLPLQPSKPALKIAVSLVQNTPRLTLTFPRRSGLPSGIYGYEASEDLVHWTEAVGVSEVVHPGETVGGVVLEKVEAQVPIRNVPQAFLRMVWKGRGPNPK